MLEKVENEIKMWKRLTDSELNEKVNEFIRGCSDFAVAYKRLLRETFVKDEQLRSRIRNAVIKQVANFSNQETKGKISEWEQMSDLAVSQDILNTYIMFGKEHLDELYIYIDKIETKERIDKIILDVVPKFRELGVLRMLESWKTLSDEELSKAVVKEIVGTGWTSTTSHFAFVKEVFPNIKDQDLKARIIQVLLDLSKLNPQDEESFGVTGRALYISIKLGIDGALSSLVTAVKIVADPTDPKYMTLVQWLNSALQEASVPEAEQYLIKQLNALPKEWFTLISSPNLPYQATQRYLVFWRAYQALRLFNQKLAQKYWKLFQ